MRSFHVPVATRPDALARSKILGIDTLDARVLSCRINQVQIDVAVPVDVESEVSGRSLPCDQRHH